jgi:hypothetical protein
MTMSTITIHGTTERRTVRSRLRLVPWLTVVPLAIVMAYADGFWMTSLRGAAGSIERTQEPFAAWLRESTLSVPFFVLAVIAALTFAAHRFGPVVSRPRTVLATALLVVAAGTMVGIYEVASSSAYDYSLQSSQAQMMASMDTSGAGGSSTQQQQASLALQVHAVGYGSGILLVTNLIVVGWVIAIRGGSVKTGAIRH